LFTIYGVALGIFLVLDFVTYVWEVLRECD